MSDDPVCPTGMVLQKPMGSAHFGEHYCISKTEEPQSAFMAFLKQINESAYEEVSKLLSKFLYLKGDEKPAVFVKWDEAEAFCKATYPDGDLPANWQWKESCNTGSDYYCTPGGILSHAVAIYGAKGPANIDGPDADKRVNERGVQDMTGNVWEWIGNMDDFVCAEFGCIPYGFKLVRGGSWNIKETQELELLASNYHKRPPDLRGNDVGFRCVAPPLCPAGMQRHKAEGSWSAFCVSKTEEPQDKFMAFLKTTNESAYEEVSRLLEGNPNVKGDRKPTVFAKWGEAKAFCKAMYPNGDLPAEYQWEDVFGNGGQSEVIYGTNGPADVNGPSAGKRVNQMGVQDMLGNVWEWTATLDRERECDHGENCRIVLGGSWDRNHNPGGTTWGRGGYPYKSGSLGDYRSSDIGFRCIADLP